MAWTAESCQEEECQTEEEDSKLSSASCLRVESSARGGGRGGLVGCRLAFFAGR